VIDLLLGGALSPTGHLVWKRAPWSIAVAVVAAIAALLLVQAGRRSWAARLGETLALGVGLAAVAIVIAEPTWVEEEGRREAGRVAVLVDASSSMGVAENGLARLDAALKIVDGLGNAEVFHFGSELSPGRPAAADLPGTDLDAALTALGERFAGERLAGVVVLTDGIDRGLLRRGFQRGENPVPPALVGPLTVVQVGEARDLVDLAVRDVDAGGYAYVHAPFKLTARLVGVGFEGRDVKVELLKDGAVARTSTVRIGKDGTAEAAFEVQPDRSGRFTYLVQVPDYAEDAVPANNSMPVVVQVVRDRIRVLQVAGSPSWDVKFMRRFLKGDPSVDLVSFFILRTKQDQISRFDPDDLSLIAFPYQQLFDEELLGFDLVIFQNFDYRPYFEQGSAKLLANLRDYVVEHGHAFVMVGGDRSFSLGAYGGTPLGDILPVAVSTTPEPPDEAPFQAVLTSAGARHPVTRLVSDSVENAEWWGRLHTVDGTNVVGGLRPDAVALLQHPSNMVGGKPQPVLAVREVGRGRTMALTVDTSWRWSLSEAALGRGNQAYLRFWKGAMRWLVGDPTLERVSVGTPRENYALGDEVRVTVRALDESFMPLTGAMVDVTIDGGGGETKLEVVTDATGEAVVTFTPDRRGAHRVRAAVKVGGAAAGAAETVFAVTSRDPELDEVVPDRAFLEWLAARTDGRYVEAGAAVEVLRDPDAGRTVWSRREVALWQAPLVALLALGGLGAAWLVRRRSGLR
jgi:uncharacterized membrane protein